MSAFLTELTRLNEDLKSLNIEWALIGGLAYSIYSDPRTTKDIDIAVVTDTEGLEEIVSKLLKRGYKDKALLMHTSPTHRLGIRVSIPSDRSYSIPVDFLYQSSGIEREIVDSSLLIEILPSLIIPVASPAHMLAMKILSKNDFDRIQDKADAISLLKIASQQDLKETQRSLVLISERGFNRGKDLIKEFKELLSALESS